MSEGQHERLALVEDVYLTALRLGEAVGAPQAVYGDRGAAEGKDNGEEPYLAEARFYIP
jgi:hypothetical protein